MKELITLSLITAIFISYIGYVISQNGIIDSISASWYDVKDGKVLFPAFTTSIVVLLIIHDPTWWTMMIAGGFMFVGGAADYKKEIPKPVHYSGAVVLIAAGLIQVSLYGYWYLPIVFLTTALIIHYLVKDMDNKVWWIELIAFFIIMIGFWFNVLT